MSVFPWLWAIPLKRGRGRPRKRPEAVIGYVGRPPKKPSGGQAKYDLAEIERRITEHMAEHGLRSRHAAICELLWNACHSAESADLQAKAREMDDARTRIAKNKKLSPTKVRVLAVEAVEAPKVKAVEELLRKRRKRTR
jgi:hypothetical protein